MTEENLQPKKNFIFLISFISAMGGYLFGFDFAVIAGALPFLRDAFSLGSWEEGFLTGSLGLGCIVGCIITGVYADKYGRKPCLLVAALIFAVSSMAMGLAQNFSFFVSMRFIAGIGVGMASLLSPLYIAEVSPANVRGRNVSLNQLTIVIGILVTNLVNYKLSSLGPDSWRWMFGSGVIPAMLFFVGILWLPESPRWLIGVGRIRDAEKIMLKMMNSQLVRSSVETIRTTSHTGGNAIRLSDPSIRAALIMGISLAVFQQFCGINVVFNYTSTIFETVGADLDRQLFETIAIGTVNLVFTLLAMWQVDKLGRRPLMLIGSMGLAIVYIILSVLLQHQYSAGWISVFVLCAIALYASSLAPVTWVLISEIFPNKIRGRATSLAIIFLWSAYFILVFTFPPLVEKLGTSGAFYLYSAICLIGYFFIKMKVKETKGQTLEQLEQNY
jgi:sugar porter (SP) family MFS transporter